MSNNIMAGIGDPYWYEWSVGLLYALDMLNPDNNIKHIILQSEDMQGLDDVVIEYKNGSAHCIQIKHTREGNTLTFSDMVGKSESKKSLLDSLCRDWKDSFQRGYSSCRAVLYTNRNAGIKKSSRYGDSKTKYTVPALRDFLHHIFKQLNSISSITEISIPIEWEKAWSVWLAEMDYLKNDNEKFIFLKSLDIKTEQAELEIIYNEISRKLSEHFHISDRISVLLDQKLCYALRTWTTTKRKKQEITREDLFEALSLAGDKIQGEHNLKVCEPFFSSRLEFVNELESKLLNREFPVVFLYGDPGSGKTNIVSHMANKNDSVVTLRFHAFKPLSAEDLYLSADKGISDPRALWGNLLIELRELFTGKLAQYNIPVSIELIDSIDELRKEVLRLAQLYSIEVGRPTIIVIDGIDHAARSGSKNSFLSTLVNPKGIPKNVCFLISGQPVMNYDMYPDWLSTEDGVLHIEVPKINEDDIKQLFIQTNKSMPEEDIELAVKIINKAVSGNTLSAVFAVNGTSYCSNIDELETEIERSKISGGLLSYYEYMWKSTLENLPKGALYIEPLMAGALTLINKKITPLLMAKIFNGENISEYVWKSSLNKLYPLVVNEDGEYRIFHNDFRIYLDRFLRKDRDSFIEVSSRLADYFLSDADDIRLKHELVFQLLTNSDRKNEFIEVFTEDYVIEAIKHKRPMRELYDQLEMTTMSLQYISANQNLLSFSCALDTLFQYQASLQWEDKDHDEEFELPIALMSERKVKTKMSFDDEVINNMLNDALLLLNYKEFDRAKKLVFRWLEGLTPEGLAELIDKNIKEQHEKHETIFETNKKRTIREILEKWGIISRAIGISFERVKRDNVSENDMDYRAQFTTGWLKKSKEYMSLEDVKYTFGNIDSFFTVDLDDLVWRILEINDEGAIRWLIDKDIFSKTSNETHVKLVSWSIVTRNTNLIEKWIKLISEKKLNYLKDADERRYDDSIFEDIARIIFILSYFEKADQQNIKKTVNEGLLKFRGENFNSSDRGYYTAHNLLVSSYYLGYLCSQIISGSVETISEEDFVWFIDSIFDRKEPLGFYEIGGSGVQQFIFTSIISIDHLIPKRLKDIFVELIVINVKKLEFITNLDLWWDYLEKNNKESELKEIFNIWMGEGGIIWGEELSEIHSIYDAFMPKAEKFGWKEDIKTINNKLNFKIIGYVGRKEYSLYLPLKWYNSLDHLSNKYWNLIGLNLLNISEYASKTGDNRADIYVSAAVSESAGIRSATDLGQFSMSSDNWDKGWIQSIFDGLIASFKTNHFTEEELLYIWNTSTTFFHIENNPRPYDADHEVRKAYISDIKQGIIQAAQRLEYSNIDKKMKKMAPNEFSKSRTIESITAIRVPERWYNDAFSKSVSEFKEKISDMESVEALEYIKSQRSSNPESFRWDKVVCFVNLIEERDHHLDTFVIEEILNLIINDRKDYSWSYDGVDSVIEVVFPYLNTDQINLLLTNIIGRYLKDSFYSSESRFHMLKEDMNSFVFFYFKTLGNNSIFEGLKRILKMHENWITGYGILSCPIYYSEQDKPFDNLSWIKFCELIKKKYYDDL